MSTEFVPGERARPEWLRTHPRAWVAAVGTVCFGAFMGQLDASVVALTYRAIGTEFDASLRAVQWVSLSYLIALAVLLVPVGRMSDRLGRKRVYLWGFGLFTATSAVCAVAPTLPVLVAVRAGQGAAAAMLQANSVALVATSAPRARLRTALGIQAAAQAIGLATGPTVGGLIVDTVGWRWVFAVNVPVGLVALGAGRFLLPRTRVSRDRPTGRVRDVLADHVVARGIAGALLAYLLLFGPIVLAPAVLQQRATSASVAGLVVAALPVGFALAAALMDRLLPRGWGSATRCRIGAAVAGFALVVLLITGASPTGFVVSLGLLGLGLGTFTPANNALVMCRVPAGTAALAGGLISSARAVGTAAGTALVATLLPVSASGRLVVAALAVLAAAAFASVGRGRAGTCQSAERTADPG